MKVRVYSHLHGRGHLIPPVSISIIADLDQVGSSTMGLFMLRYKEKGYWTNEETLTTIPWPPALVEVFEEKEKVT